MQRVAPKPTYKGHPLPNDCPPADATHPLDGILLRLVRSQNVSSDDFLSCHAEKKIQPKKCDHCRWRACSVWVEATPIEKLSGLTKLPNLAHMKFVAHVAVDASAGRVKPHEKDKQHLSFWMADTFSPETAVKKVHPL
jgi:hypothetical protein